MKVAIKYYGIEGQAQMPVQVFCIYAAAPFVRAADICRGLDVLAIAGNDYAFSVTSYGPRESEKSSLVFRRSLYIVKDLRAGDFLTSENVRSRRPGLGLPPKCIEDVLGKKAARDVRRGTPASWNMIQ